MVSKGQQVHVEALVEQRFLHLVDHPRGLFLGRLVDRQMDIRTQHDRSLADHVG